MSDFYVPDMSHIHQQAMERADDLAGKNDAQRMFNHLSQKLKQFQDELGEDEESGVQLANFGEVATLNIRSMSYTNPNLIEFSGFNLDGNRVVLIQHITQLSFLLVALKALDDEPFRIGFSRE